MNAETSRPYLCWLKGDYRRQIRLQEEHDAVWIQRYCDHTYNGTLTCVVCKKIRREPWYSRLARKWFVVK